MLLLDIGFVQTDLGTMIDLLRSRVTLEAEIVVLRQRINVLRRANPKRLPFGSIEQADIRRRLPAVSQDV
jgi:hypothetical protein